MKLFDAKTWIILILAFLLLFSTNVLRNVSARYSPIASVPAALEVIRLAVMNLQQQHQKDVDNHLLNVNNRDPGVVSLLLSSGEREDRATWLITTNAAKADLEALMADVVALSPTAP